MTDSNWLFLFPLHREAASFSVRNTQCKIGVIGMGPERAANSTRRLIEQHRPVAVILAGFAGALRDGLEVGDLIIASQVINCRPAAPTRALEKTLMLALRADRVQPPIINGTVISTSSVVGDPMQKRTLHRQFGADVVDMESFAVAEVCDLLRIPWAVMRVISDTVDTKLSPHLVQLMQNGDVTWLRAMWSALKHPRLISEFIRLARDTRIASGRLADALSSLHAK